MNPEALSSAKALSGAWPIPNTTPQPNVYRPIVATVRLFVNIAGRNFQAEADTLPEAEDKITAKVAAAIEECGQHIERMEGFLAAR